MAKKRRQIEEEELNITSMMDMMTIILVFLLKSFGASELVVNPSIKLPVSKSDQPPSQAVNVVVSKSAIIVDNKEVVGIESYDDPKYPGQKLYRIADKDKVSFNVPKLQAELQTVVAQAESFSAKAASAGRSDIKFEGKVIFQIDKDIPFALLRDVMYNAGQAKFSEFEFVVISSTRGG